MYWWSAFVCHSLKYFVVVISRLIWVFWVKGWGIKSFFEKEKECCEQYILYTKYMNDYTWINRYIKLKINSILAGLLFTFVETKYKRCSQVKLVFSVLPSLVSFWSSQFNLCWKKWIYAGLVWNCPVISTNKAYSASNKAINLKDFIEFWKNGTFI